MSPVAALFAGGGAAAVVLLAMAFEFAMLVRAGRGPQEAALAISPGALIVAALGAAMTGADWRWIALPLASSLPLHLLDLRARGWLGRRRAVTPRSRSFEHITGQAKGWRGS